MTSLVPLTLLVLVAVCERAGADAPVRPGPASAAEQARQRPPAHGAGSDPGEAVVVTGTRILRTPSPSAPALGSLPVGERLSILARTDVRFTCAGAACGALRHRPLEFAPEGEGFFWYEVRAADGTVGWVSGEHVAIRAGSPWIGETVDLGWGGQDSMRQDLDGDGRPEELALAVRDAGWEWPTGWLDRCPDGYLVVADGRGQGVAVLHVAGILIGGYGDLVGAIAARDVTGDGSPELLLRIDRTVSEVGYGGHELRVLRYRGGALDELLRDEATITMLAGVGELAWVTLDVRPGAVRRVAIRALPYGRCQAPVVADPDTATGRCLERREVTWRWDAERQRFSDPGTGAAHPATAVIARDTPLRDRPDETAPASGTLIAGAGVALERVDGWYVAEPIGGIPGHWVRVVAGDGTAGWIPSHQLVPDDAVLTAFLRGDRSATSQVVPVRWDGL